MSDRKLATPKKLCYWSIGDRKCIVMLRSMVKSARNAGVKEDIHVWSDRKIKGAITHFISRDEKSRFFKNALYPAEFKFWYQKKMLDFQYDVYIYVDSDIFFVRQPPDPLAFVKDDGFHVFLEGDLLGYGLFRMSRWYGCPMSVMIKAMRELGVRTNAVRGVNGGFWMVRRESVVEFVDLVYKFYKYIHRKGYTVVNDEPPICYAAHMLFSDPQQHLLSDHFDFYGNYNCVEARTKLPDGTPWVMEYKFTREKFLVNPALVHCFRSKHLLHEYTLSLSGKILFRVLRFPSRVIRVCRRILRIFRFAKRR